MTGPLTRLRSQTLLLLLLVLGISHVVGLYIYANDRRSALESDGAIDIAERTAALAELLNSIPDTWWTNAIRGNQSRQFRASISNEPHVTTPEDPDPLIRLVRSQIAFQLPSLAPDEIRVARVEELDGPDDHPGRSLRIAVPLKDDFWLQTTGLTLTSTALWPRSAGVSILLVLSGVIVAGSWMLYRVTSPLTTFAQAADRLGKDLSSEALPETGPEEVVKAARAFNEMQNRIKRMVDNRTEMLAAISHDLRTPLTLLRLRLERLSDGEERQHLLAKVEEMESMIGSVIGFARATFQEEPNRLVDVSALLHSLCEDLADTGADIVLQTPEAVRLTCRRIALKRALGNLIDNALRYAGHAEVALETVAGEVVIEVRDRGPGFDQQDSEQLFTPFFRAERSRHRDSGGVGLGLSIAKAIIESHGGTLVVENRTEGGACARVRLPH